MSSSTPRFSKTTLQWIQKASRQKRPDWLDKNREDYETYLLAPLRHLALHLKTKLASTALGYNFPQKGIGRLKRPAARAEEYGSLYKDWISYSAARPRKSRFDHNPNLFFMIYPDDPDGDEVLVAGGLYMPSSRQMRAIREAIAKDASAFERLFASKDFSARFPGGFSKDKISSRNPRGFDSQHPKMEMLRLQAFFVWRSYTLREFTSARFADLVAQDFEQILRLNVLLEQAIEGRWPSAAPGLKRAKMDHLSSLLEEVQAPLRKMDF